MGIHLRTWRADLLYDQPPVGSGVIRNRRPRDWRLMIWIGQRVFYIARD